MWGGGGAWAATRSGARYQPDATAGQRGNTSGVAQPVPHTSAGSPPSQKGSHLQEQGLHLGCRTLRRRGTPGCRPSCPISLQSVDWRRGRPIGFLRTTHLGNLGAGVTSAGLSRGVQPFPAEHPEVLPETKFRASCLGNHSAQIHGGSYVAAPGVPQRAELGSRKGASVCVCVNMRAHWCQNLERIWLQMSLSCAYLTHVYE